MQMLRLEGPRKVDDLLPEPVFDLETDGPLIRYEDLRMRMIGVIQQQRELEKVSLREATKEQSMEVHVFYSEFLADLIVGAVVGVLTYGVLYLFNAITETPFSGAILKLVACLFAVICFVSRLSFRVFRDFKPKKEISFDDIQSQVDELDKVYDQAIAKLDDPAFMATKMKDYTDEVIGQANKKIADLKGKFASEVTLPRQEIERWLSRARLNLQEAELLIQTPETHLVLAVEEQQKLIDAYRKEITETEELLKNPTNEEAELDRVIKTAEVAVKKLEKDLLNLEDQIQKTADYRSKFERLAAGVSHGIQLNNSTRLNALQSLLQEASAVILTADKNQLAVQRTAVALKAVTEQLSLGVGENSQITPKSVVTTSLSF